MKSKRVDLWATDEVHFQQHGSRCRMWIPPEIKNPVLYHEPTRKSVGYFGAVRIRDGKFVYQSEMEKFNGESFHAFLKKLRQRASCTSRKVVVISDNARYHHAKSHQEWRRNCGKEFELLFLPPYSPELNPIERVWKLVRRLCLHNQYFPDIETVIDLVENKFAEWAYGNKELKSLCAI